MVNTGHRNPIIKTDYSDSKVSLMYQNFKLYSLHVGSNFIMENTLETWYFKYSVGLDDICFSTL